MKLNGRNSNLSSGRDRFADVGQIIRLICSLPSSFCFFAFAAKFKYSKLDRNSKNCDRLCRQSVRACDSMAWNGEERSVSVAILDTVPL